MNPIDIILRLLLAFCLAIYLINLIELIDRIVTDRRKKRWIKAYAESIEFL